MRLAKLTEAEIKRRCDEQVWQRGEDYYRSGRVRRCLKSARGLQAQVHGTTVYDVRITERRGKLIAICTCPFAQSWEGYCKHIVATLLAWLEEPERFVSTEGFQGTLKKKTKGELVEILSRICEAYPRIAQDFLGVGEREFNPRAAVEEVLEASLDECTPPELMRRLEPIASRAEAALARGDAELARRVYYELILGCLAVDEEYGSTEIFPANLVYTYAQGYQEAVEADPARAEKAAVILEEIARMEKSELVELEGVYFDELRRLLGRAEKKRAS
ncbi:MAG: hypothetical protein NUW06_03560 [Candidatus Acetothermia bacterium]|jgi:uncharacterized Zn finger protein|nr:hypothetical protein [Candidatus Acetothermia bacterium]MDH7504735.1 hypothetical protein [Candidatus Acetothermia bacterium]